MGINFKRFKEDFENRPEFKRKSFLLYKKLDKILYDKNIIIDNFEELNNWFIKDIRLRRTLLKYISYIENRFSAELINFWYKNQKKINDLILNQNFIQFNSKEKWNKNIIYLNEIMDKNKEKVSYHIIDNLTFGDKFTLASILVYYFKINKINVNLKSELFIKLKDVSKIVSLRNHIVHHGFVMEHKNLTWFLGTLLILVDDNNGWKEKLDEEIKNIKQDFSSVL